MISGWNKSLYGRVPFELSFENWTGSLLGARMGVNKNKTGKTQGEFWAAHDGWCVSAELGKACVGEETDGSGEAGQRGAYLNH